MTSPAGASNDNNSGKAPTSRSLEQLSFAESPGGSRTTCIYTARVSSGAPSSALTATSHNPFDAPGGGGAAAAVVVGRDLRPEEVDRVMDFSNLEEESGPPPEEDRLRVCLEDKSGGGGASDDDDVFVERRATLRGGFLLFVVEEESRVGVVPLSRVSVELPPGGRRAFRGHADASRSGYEFVVRHEERPAVFLVSDTLLYRDRWAEAIRTRAEIRRPTTLRPDGGGVGGTVPPSSRPTSNNSSQRSGLSQSLTLPGATGVGLKSGHYGRALSMDLPTMEENASDGNNDVALLHETFKQFTSDHTRTFSASKWVDEFYENNTEFDAPKMCRTVEEYQAAVKQGLRGAVLEQYEYFVEASGEMTTMGRELQHLRDLADAQVRAIDRLKEIRFADLLDYDVHRDHPRGVRYDVNSSDDEDERYLDDGRPLGDSAGSRYQKWRQRHGDDDYYDSLSDDDDDDADEDEDSRSSNSEGGDSGPGWGVLYPNSAKKNTTVATDDATPADGSNTHTSSVSLEIPAWLKDVTGEISAYVSQCRYTDATDLILKAQQELAELERQRALTEGDDDDAAVVRRRSSRRRASRRRAATLRRTAAAVDALADRAASRLATALRRQNDALLRLARRERADPLERAAPPLDPACLRDDDVPLRLLVRLGRHNDAAEAYAARRSLSLGECLRERPLSDELRADVVVNAARVGQSFFRCLALAVEGFLDLFVGPAPGAEGRLDAASSPARAYVTPRPGDADDDATSLRSDVTRRVPPGALSSVVLWCDAELVRFADVFAGDQVLGNLTELACSPSTGDGLADDLEMIDRFEERGEFAAAAILKKRLSPSKSARGGVIDADSVKDDFQLRKERKNAIHVAAQCVDQAFQFASENLDSIGLPLVPRFAECLRNRLHGCEAEIAEILQKRWCHYVFDWFASPSAAGGSRGRDHRHLDPLGPPRRASSRATLASGVSCS